MTGFVYAIGDDVRVKIGWSADPIKRLVKLKSDCPDDVKLLGLVPATKAQEAEAHRLLAAWHIQGEWHRRQGAVAAFVDSLPKPAPRPIHKARTRHAHPLCEYRAKNNITLQEFSDTTGISRPHLSRIESGRARPGARVINQISRATGIPGRALRPDIYELLYGEAAE